MRTAPMALHDSAAAAINGAALTHLARYTTGPALHPDRLRALAAMAWVGAYQDALNDAAIPPNGEDFNELADGVAIILGGGVAPRICITHAGR